jgi:hypothetical protein
MPSDSGWDSKVPMQPRRETSSSSGSTVFQVTNRGAAVGGVSGREDVDVAGVAAPAAESDVEDDEDDEDKTPSAARRRRAGFKGASEGPVTEAELALYAAHEDWICSRERGLRLLRSASRASKHTTQCSTVAILGCSGDTDTEEARKKNVTRGQRRRRESVGATWLTKERIGTTKPEAKAKGEAKAHPQDKAGK